MLICLLWWWVLKVAQSVSDLHILGGHFSDLGHCVQYPLHFKTRRKTINHQGLYVKKWYSSFEPNNDIILSNFCHIHTFIHGTYFLRKRPRWIKGIDEWLILDLDRKAQTEKKNYWIHPRTRIKVLKYLRHNILFFWKIVNLLLTTS